MAYKDTINQNEIVLIAEKKLYFVLVSNIL